MNGSSELESLLKRIDGRGYPAYKDIRGCYDFGDFILSVDHVQGDPFASPSRLRIIVRESDAGFPGDCRSSISRDIAFRDYLARMFDVACRKYSRGGRGSGKSGFIGIAVPGQEILSRPGSLPVCLRSAGGLQAGTQLRCFSRNSLRLQGARSFHRPLIWIPFTAIS